MLAKPNVGILDRRYPRILLAAEGFLELGMLDHAALELEKAPPEVRTEEDVMSLRCQIFMAAKQWVAARDVAKHLVAVNPKDAQHWIWAAFATRRAENIETARLWFCSQHAVELSVRRIRRDIEVNLARPRIVGRSEVE